MSRIPFNISSNIAFSFLLYHNAYNFALSKKKCDICNLHVDYHPGVSSYSRVKKEEEKNVLPF